MTTLLVKMPSCPMFFAITKQDTVVGEPTMMRIASSSLYLNPNNAAMGRKMAGRMNSLIAVAAMAGLMRLRAALPEKDAPTASRATGVAVPPTVESVDCRMVGSLMRSREKGTPSRMPMIIGFFATFTKARLTAEPF